MPSEPLTHSYAAEREVRFAVVLYGGVSLAIYMNGIIQELFAMVRATAPDVTGDGLHLAATDLRGAENIYREVACRATDGSDSPDATKNVVKTRFVIDILAGTSAGGINGVLLAKALANDQSIDTLAQLWIDEGDIAKLLNDRDAVGDIGSLSPEKPPQSFLSGQRMLYKLLEAIDGVSASNPKETPSPYADQIDLWVTSTDLDGREQVVPTSDQARLGTVRETDNHVRFHFVYDNAEGLSDPINMFTVGFDPALAFAARATSSFPGAFRPLQWDDLVEVEAAFIADNDDRTWLDIESEPIRRLFQRYDGPDAIRRVSFADGGYLDNQPVDLVMQTLPKRRADLPVSRRVLFVDPNPGDDKPPAPAKGDPVRTDLLSTLLKSVTLPRVQTISGEIDRIEALGPPLAVRNAIYAAVESSLSPSTPNPPLPSAGYLMLRVSNTLDDLAAAFARIGFPDRAFDTDSVQYRIARAFLQRSTPAGRADAHLAEFQFVAGLDLGYELRRISFVQHQVAREMRDPATDATTRDALRTYRRALANTEQHLVECGRTLRARVGGALSDSDLAGLRSALATLGTDGPAAPADPAADALVAAVLAKFATALDLQGMRDDIDALTTALGDELTTLRWRSFQQYDDATLALSELLPGENDDIKVVRVSPRDASAVYKEKPDKPKLAGTAVHHFGGFFSAQWRRNDIMWGRLDAAERLINLVLEDATEAIRAQHIHDAQARIIGELLIDRTGSEPKVNAEYVELFRTIAPGSDRDANGNIIYTLDPNTVLQNLAHYIPPPGPTRDDVLALATRAARVTDALSAGIGEEKGALATVRTWIGAIMRPAAQVGELVLDRSVKSLLIRRLLDLAVYASILMIVVGAFLAGKPVVTFGWTVLAIALGAKVTVNIARNWVRQRQWWWWPVAVLTVVFAALAIEGLLLYGGPTRWVGLFLLGTATSFVIVALGPALSGSAHKKPAAAMLSGAGLILLAAAAFGVFQIADKGRARICRQSDWEKSTINALPGSDCPAEPVTPLPAANVEPG